MNGKRFFASVLCAVSLLACFSCKVKPLAPPSTGTAAATTTVATDKPATTTAEPAADYGGALFRLRIPWAEKYFISGDDPAADARIEACINEIYEKFNANITIVSMNGVEDLLPELLAGTHGADVVGLRSYEVAALAKNRLIYPVDDPLLFSAGLDPADARRWYNGPAAMPLIDGRVWTLRIASALDVPAFGSVVLYNKTLTAGAGNLETLPDAGNWIRAEYLRLSEAVGGLADESNPGIWGSAVESAAAPLLSDDGQFVAYADGKWAGAMTELYVENFGYLRQIYTSGACFAGPFGEAMQNFKDGNVAFLWISTETLEQHAELKSADAGVLPPPKRIAATGDATVTAGYNGYAIPTANPEIQKTVDVFNAFALRMNDGDWFDGYCSRVGFTAKESAIVKKYVLERCVFDNAALDKDTLDYINDMLFTKLLELTEPELLIAQTADNEINRILDSNIND